MLTLFWQRLSLFLFCLACTILFMTELIGTGIRGETFMAFITRRGQTGWLQEMVVMDTGGSIIWRLSQHFPRYGALTWSPDGKWFALVYRADANNTLQIMNTAGWQSQIPGQEVYHVQWLPDSDSLVYVSGDYLYRAYIDNPEPVNLTAHLDGAADKPLLSPDGNLLYFEHAFAYNSDVYVMTLETGNVERLTTADGYNYPVSISADGSHLAIFTDRNDQPEIIAMDTQTHKETILGSLDWNDVTYTRWSPDSQWLAFPGVDKDVLIHNIYTGEKHRLEYKRLMAGISWSPNSQWVLLIDLQRQVVMMNVQTGETRTLEENISQHLAWSPDNAHLALVTSRGHLIVMELETGELERVDDVRILLPIQWTRDSNALLFEHDGDILLYDIETGSRNNLTDQYDGKFRPGLWRPG